ncbi:MAG: ATP-binding cassette domain-containing protein [Anaerovoracaceae bacterium]
MHQIYHQSDPAAGNAQTTSNATDPAVRKAEEILASLDLLQFKDRHPASLSEGQKQRLAIATSVASKKSILLFSTEPTSGLDYRHMLETAAFFRKLQASGHTIYVVTHDPEFIIERCTDIIRLKKGRITELYAMNDI